MAGEPATVERDTARGFTRADVIILLIFTAVALVYNYCRWKGASPFVFLGGDAANIVYFAAALDHPANFAKDPLLSNPPQHWSFIVQLIRLLGRCFADYGTGFISMLWLTVFLQLAGFYGLGRAVIGSRFYAFLFAIAAAAKFRLYSIREFWGVYEDPIPRTAFQALLPFLLLAAYSRREKPAAWPLLMLAAGLMIYVHPVGAPGVAFALWLGFLLFLPKTWSRPKRLGFMLLCGAAFVAVGIPFLAYYVSHMIMGKAVDYNEVYPIIKMRFAPGQLNIPAAAMDFVLMSLKTLVLPASLAGAAVVAIRGGRDDRKGALLIGTWIAGMLFVSLAIPFAEQIYAKAHDMLPLEVDLVRGYRYVFPLALLFCFWALARLQTAAPPAGAGKLIPIIGIIGVLGFFTLTNRLEAGSFSGIPARIKEKALLPHERGREITDMVKAVRRLTPPGSSVFSETLNLPIRYYSLRAAAFSPKDGGPLCYSDSEACIRWYKAWRRLEELEKIKAPGERLAGTEALARELRADYLLVEYAPEECAAGLEPVHSNRYYSLFKLK